MQYMGGKERIHKHILRAIEFAKWDSGATKYLEPFVGGASIASRIRGFDEVVLADAEPLVCAVWNAAREGWSPYEIDAEQYSDLRDVVGAGPMAGYAAFGVSFGGKKWGGYAKHSPGKYEQIYAVRGIARKAEGLSVDLLCVDYMAHSPEAGWLVYCDPPYAGTTGYGSAWDAEAFWSNMDEWAGAGATVLVSEYEAPSHWTSVWSGKTPQSLSKNRPYVTERLFTR